MEKKTAWTNVNLITMQNAKYSIINNAGIIISAGKIVDFGPMDQIQAQLNNCDKQFDGDNKWISPGLIDCHTHLVYGSNRSNEFSMRLSGQSYEAIARNGGGIKSTINATIKTNQDNLYQQANKRLQDFLNEGVTTIEIKSGYGGDLETERNMLVVAKKLGENNPVTVIKTFLGAHVLPHQYDNNKTKYLDYICREVLPILLKEDLVDQIDAFCESIAFNCEELEPYFDLAVKLKLPIKCHAEQLSNCGGIKLATKYKALSVDHIEFASQEDIKLMQANNTVAVLLPGAFYNLCATKKPPVDLLRKFQVPIAIASDSNPGSSPVCSLLLMLNMACNLFKLTPEEAFAGITIQAAKALGLNYCGVIEPGKVADLVFWDIKNPDELAYYIGHNPCIRVIKAGEIVLDKN